MKLECIALQLAQSLDEHQQLTKDKVELSFKIGLMVDDFGAQATLGDASDERVEAFDRLTAIGDRLEVIDIEISSLRPPVDQFFNLFPKVVQLTVTDTDANKIYSISRGPEGRLSIKLL